MTCRDLTGLDTLQASALLRRLRDQAFLAKEGSGSRTYYVPGARLLETAVPDSPQLNLNPHQSLSDSHQPPLYPPQSLPEPLQQRHPSPSRPAVPTATCPRNSAPCSGRA